LIDVAGVSGPPVDPALPDAPSIVVLPFENMSGDPEQEYFSDGLTEDLTSARARFPELFVIARNSAFVYKGQQANVQDVGRELGVRYVLEGSVRKVGDRVRVTAQLIDATTGGHVWSERYDRDLATCGASAMIATSPTSSRSNRRSPKRSWALCEARSERLKRTASRASRHATTPGMMRCGGAATI
jgi:adenylate cyclase